MTSLVLVLLILSISVTNGFDLTMGFRSGVKDFFTGIFKRKAFTRTDAELKTGIAKFYDESSSIWLSVWGEDMHHGYYPSDEFKDHKQAQLLMINKSLEFGFNGDPALVPVKSLVDVGCGVGGSSRYMASTLFKEASGRGISLSPYQIKRANEFTADANLSDRLEYQVADAMAMPFASDSFDLTWSMESGEHMPNKEKFLNELFRVTAPGGRILIVTWCHRELNEGETALTEKELRLLAKINKAYYLPEWVPASTYLKHAHTLGLEDIRQDDWTQYVAPFWPAVIRSAFVPANFVRMVWSGRKTVKGAVAALWMLRGFKKGLVKFALITGRKPSEAPAPAPAAAL